MPRAPKEKKPYHHGDLRRALLDATLELAEEHGPAGVTLREAARRAGVSQTAPYRHFPDKLAMLAAASAEGFVLFRAELEQSAAGAGPDPRAQLEEMLVAYVRFALEHPAYFRLMLGHGSPPKASTPELQVVARDAFQLFLAAVRRVKVNARDPIFHLWGLVHGVATLALERQLMFAAPIETIARSTRAAVRALF